MFGDWSQSAETEGKQVDQMWSSGKKWNIFINTLCLYCLLLYHTTVQTVLQYYSTVCTVVQRCPSTDKDTLYNKCFGLGCWVNVTVFPVLVKLFFKLSLVEQTNSSWNMCSTCDHGADNCPDSSTCPPLPALPDFTSTFFWVHVCLTACMQGPEIVDISWSSDLSAHRPAGILSLTKRLRLVRVFFFFFKHVWTGGGSTADVWVSCVWREWPSALWCWCQIVSWVRECDSQHRHSPSVRQAGVYRTDTPTCVHTTVSSLWSPQFCAH